MGEFISLLDILHYPTAWFYHLPEWIGYTLLGLMMMLALTAGGFILARMGIKPLFVLFLLIPVVQIVVFWILAYAPWQAERLRREQRGNAS